MKKRMPITFNKSEMIAFLNTHKRVRLATAEGDTPHVRSCFIHRAGENVIIFHTFKNKDLYKQLCENPKVEMAVDDSPNGIPHADIRYHEQIAKVTEIRVSGIIEFVKDKQLEEEILAECPSAKQRVEQGYEMVVFRMRKCLAMIQTVDTNLMYPKYWTEL